MRYSIYSGLIQSRPVVCAAAMTALIAAPIFSLKADVEAGIAAARHGNFKVDRDTSQALRWYERAANQDLALAQYALAIHYRDGIGVQAGKNLSLTLN